MVHQLHWIYTENYWTLSPHTLVSGPSSSLEYHTKFNSKISMHHARESLQWHWFIRGMSTHQLRFLYRFESAQPDLAVTRITVYIETSLWRHLLIIFSWTTYLRYKIILIRNAYRYIILYFERISRSCFSGFALWVVW